MRKSITFLILLLIASITSAQKKTVAISTFEASRNVTIERVYVEAIENKVKESIRKTNRFKVVDRGSYKKLREEREFQKKEEFIDGKTTKSSAFEGAEQIVTGNVNQITFLRKTKSNAFYYKCKISFTLQIIDLVSGRVIASASIEPKKNIIENFISTENPDTKEGALFETLEKTQDEIDKFIAENFPVTTKIIEITKSTSKKAKNILINTGTFYGAKEKQLFKIVELVPINIDGEEEIRKVTLGMAKIINVEGEKISEAKITKGGDVILEKFNSGAKIECYSQN